MNGGETLHDPNVPQQEGKQPKPQMCEDEAGTEQV